MTQFRLLGPLAAVEDGRALALGAPKQRALLATLLLHAGEVVSRDRLIDAVWGEEPPASALQSLQVYVHGLRRALGPERIETQGVGYRLAVEDAELDLAHFDAFVERGRAALDSGAAAAAARELTEALALWSGRPLADLAEEPVAQTEGPRLEDARLRAVELLHEAQLELGEHELLLDSLPPLLAEHPYRERLHAQYVRALYRAGRQKDSLDALRLAQRALLDDLGIDAGPELRALERRILGQDPSLAAPAAEHALPALPVPATPMLGRHLEVAALTALFRRDDVRLVTLTGPGGAGKTRLALAVAHEFEPGARDGVVFVDLAAVDDVRLLAGAIAHELGVHESEGPLEDELAADLRGRSMLLVLDNLEQLLPDVTLVSRLLREAPRLRILATSRAPLRLSGEHEYPVPPLDPDEAVRLFGARATAVDPAFSLDEKSSADVAEICRRLDGLPLAIELAAARIKLLPVGAIARRLEQALDLLTGGARDLPERQRTLRATLDWSYQLAEPNERDLLARLAVFAGGFTIDAAEALGGDVETVASLVDKSLVRRGSTGRFSLLETIREYAFEHLADVDASRRAHAEFFLERARADDHYLIDEPENLRAALTWAVAAGDVALEVDILVASRQFWVIRGELTEARRHFDAAIARTAGGDPALRARALVNGAVFPYRQGAFDIARAYWEEALSLFRELGDDDEVGRCLAELAAVAVGTGDLDAAERQYLDSVEHFTRHGNRMRSAMALSNLGTIASMRGDHERAAEYLGQAIEIQRGLDRDGLGISLHNLSRTLTKLDRVDESRVLLAESVAIARELGYRELLGYCLGGAAELAAHAGDPERAARLLGTSQAVFDSIGVPIQGDEAATQDRLTDELRATLGDDAFDALMREGREADAADIAAGALS